MTQQRIHNLENHHTCPYCDNTGWVELLGTIKAHGYTYSRGSTACKFCERGLKRWQRMRDLHQPVIDDYTAGDVDMPTPYVPASKADARAAIHAIQATWSKPRPVAIDKTETSGDVKQRIEQAQQALDSGNARTPAHPPAPRAVTTSPAADAQEAASEPPFAPTPHDDIPF